MRARYIFGGSAAVISEAKQTGPRLWCKQRPLCESLPPHQPRATSLAAKRTVQGHGNQGLKVEPHGEVD